jgi:hypothetical protein
MIPPDLEKWLEDAGYEHYIFLSYPREPDADVMKVALAIATAVRQRLSDYTIVNNCRRVFVDEHCLPKGDFWEPRIKHALCRSVVLVAVCAPIYYRQEHHWCGREYKAMQTLTSLRKGGAVFPLIVRKFRDYPLPAAVSAVQYVDLVREANTYANFTRRARFQKAVDEILELVVSVATALRAKEAIADPLSYGFEFPQNSAFDDYNGPAEPVPLRPRP